MPDLIRHPEGLGSTGFRLEFIPMKIGAGMTILIEGVIYKQTLINSSFGQNHFQKGNLKNEEEAFGGWRGCGRAKGSCQGQAM